VIVREEVEDDRAASIDVERAAFGSEEEVAIVEAVRDEPESFALVAELDGRVVGHVQLSKAWVGADEVLALGPIGVEPAHQRMGIGSALVAAALEEARRREGLAVILLGSPAYYGRRGFVPAARHGLRNPFTGVRDDGFEIREEDFQIAVIDRGRAAQLTGEVRWHAAFG
jgi:putative acetyltransferase